MALGAQTTAIIDVPLTNVSNMMKPSGLICEELLTPLKVKLASGILGKYGTSHMKLVDSRIVGRGAAPRVQLIERDVSQTYKMESHGLEGLVTADDYRNVEKPFNAEKDETEALSLNLLLAKEVGLAKALANVANGVTLSGPDKFSDLQNSDPIGVSDDAVKSIVQKSGKRPNLCIMDTLVFLALRRHPAIFERLGFKYNQAGNLSEANVAEALGVSEIKVAEGFYDSAKRGQPASLARIWGAHLWWAYIEKSPQPYQTTGGYYLTYEGKVARGVSKEPTFNPQGGMKVLVTDDYCMLISDENCFYCAKTVI